MLTPKIFKFDYQTNLYLSNCDLINKCSLSSVILKPRISKIVLNLHLNNAEENLTSFNINGKVESFLSLYLFGLRKSLLVINNDLRIPTNFFKLKMLFSERSEIDFFLSNLFNENSRELSSEKSSKEKLNKVSSILIEDELLTSLTTKFNIGSFFEISNFLDENYLQSKLKKLELKIEFSFKGCESKTQNSVKNLIKNVPLFWISC